VKMKLAVSQMAWNPSDNENIFAYLADLGFSGIEILPTIMVGEEPYEKKDLALKFKKQLWQNYRLKISSMQSLLYGRTENLFGEKDERKKILAYLKKAILFAETIECPNLVFGSPKARLLGEPTAEKLKYAHNFFKELGDFAALHGTCFSLEANAAIYGGDYVLTTREALNVIKEVFSLGFRLNFDLGTLIVNEENLEMLRENLDLVNHIHISEPFLAEIKKREIHKEMAQLLKELHYDKYVSLEMKNLGNMQQTKKNILYVNEIFG